MRIDVEYGFIYETHTWSKRIRDLDAAHLNLVVADVEELQVVVGLQHDGNVEGVNVAEVVVRQPEFAQDGVATQVVACYVGCVGWCVCVFGGARTDDC